MRIKYDDSLIKCMSLFQSRTHAAVKDCFVDELSGLLTFIVQPGEIGKAIGKQGSTIQQMEAIMKRRIKVVEFSPSLQEFVRNLIMPLRVAGISEEEGIVTIAPGDLKIRGILIGRNASSLRNLESQVKRYFPIQEIKIEGGR